MGVDEAPSGDAYEDRGEELIGDKLQDEAVDVGVDVTKKHLGLAVARVPLDRLDALRPVGGLLRLTSFGMTALKGTLGKVLQVEATGVLTRVCGKQALKAIVKKAGLIRGAAVLGSIAIDGPLLFGDALAVLFAADTAVEVYHLGELFLDGHEANKEIERRKDGVIEGIEVLGPLKLVERYKDAGDLDDSESKIFIEMLMKEKNVAFRMYRDGFGWELWNINQGKLQSISFYDEGGAYMAGITEEQLKEIEAAGTEVSRKLEAGQPYWSGMGGTQIEPGRPDELENPKYGAV